MFSKSWPDFLQFAQFPWSSVFPTIFILSLRFDDRTKTRLYERGSETNFFQSLLKDIYDPESGLTLRIMGHNSILASAPFAKTHLLSASSMHMQHKRAVACIGHKWAPGHPPNTKLWPFVALLALLAPIIVSWHLPQPYQPVASWLRVSMSSTIASSSSSDMPCSY